jgi:hypothetical protein
MPRTPKRHKRPADVISNAVHIVRVATGEIDESSESVVTPPKNPAAVELGRRGGAARAKNLSRAKRRAIAKQAAKARWK